MNEPTLQLAYLYGVFGVFIGFIGTNFVLIGIRFAMRIATDLKEQKKKKAMKTRCRKCGHAHPIKGERTDVRGRRTYYVGCPNCGTKTEEYQTEEDALDAWRKMNRRTNK